jgi:DNA-binding XRE family transcriptional regulator
MSYGYSFQLVEANKSADDESWGVVLGRTCIKLNIPVSEIAGKLDVSRATIYNWFWGTTSPSRAHCEKIERLLPRLKAKK